MKKRIFKIICTVLVFAVLQGAVAWAISPISFSHWVKHDIREHREEIDTLFLGASHMYIDVDPKLFDSKAGIGSCSLNCGTTSQQLSESYFYMRDLYDYCPNLKNIFVDVYLVSFMKQTQSKGTDLQRKTVMADRFMGLKFKAAYMAKEFKIEEIPQYLFKSTYYKDHLYEIPNLLKLKLSDEYKNFEGDFEGLYEPYYHMGYIPFNKPSKNDYILPAGIELSSEINENNFDYLNRIIRFCKEKGLTLYFTQLPLSDDAYEKEEKYGAEIRKRLNKIAEENNIRFININDRAVKSSLLTDADFYDAEHLTITGSVKVTEYIADSIK